MEWKAVEVGVDEWFLGRPDGLEPDHGYDPFIDLGDMERQDAELLAAKLNAAIGAAEAEEREACAALADLRAAGLSQMAARMDEMGHHETAGVLRSRQDALILLAEAIRARGKADAQVQQ